MDSGLANLMHGDESGAHHYNWREKPLLKPVLAQARRRIWRAVEGPWETPLGRASAVLEIGCPASQTERASSVLSPQSVGEIGIIKRRATR